MAFSLVVEARAAHRFDIARRIGRMIRSTVIAAASQARTDTDVLGNHVEIIGRFVAR